MLTRDGARLRVLLELRRQFGLRSGPDELVILDDYTIEREWGWVFFYTSRGCQDGDMRYGLVGGGPYLVNRHDGSIRETGSARSVEYYVAEYEVELERHRGTWELFIGETPDAPLSVISHLRQALGLTPVEVNALRKRLPSAWRAGAWSDLEPHLARLLAAGLSVEIRRPPDHPPR